MNPVYHSGVSGELKEGNLKLDGGGFTNTANGYGAVSTFAIPKDKKIYLEVECTDQAGNLWMAGFATQSGLESGPSSTTVGGSNAITMYNRSVMLNGTENDYGSSAGIGGFGVAKFATGDILGMAIDGATGKVWFSRNGTYFGAPQGHQSGAGSTGDPAAGTNEIGTITGGTTEDVFVILSANGATNDLFVNFGQDSQNVSSAQSDGEGIGTFEYAPPTGYVALCTANLTTPAIGPTESSQAGDNFNTVLWSGDGSSSRGITGVGFQPDWVWIKTRNNANEHSLFDSVRGVAKDLESNSTDAEQANNVNGYLNSFDSDGFTVVDGSSGSALVNYSSGGTTNTYVAWNWKAGGSASSNSDGSTTSSVSANTDAGFSILTYTADAATGTVGHGLNSAPELIIGRPRSDTNWFVMETNTLSANQVLNLDSTAAAYNPGVNHFNDTFPTSTVVSYGGYMGNALSNDDKLMYCFHSVEGYSKVGSYIGNANADGPFVFTGFRPAFVLLKIKSAANAWFIYDDKREGYNEANDTLSPNYTAVEDSTYKLDLLSNGFKIKSSQNAHNQSGQTFIYLAFAEAPFKFANAR